MMKLTYKCFAIYAVFGLLVISLASCRGQSFPETATLSTTTPILTFTPVSNATPRGSNFFGDPTLGAREWLNAAMQGDRASLRSHTCEEIDDFDMQRFASTIFSQLLVPGLGLGVSPSDDRITYETITPSYTVEAQVRIGGSAAFPLLGERTINTTEIWMARVGNDQWQFCSDVQDQFGGRPPLVVKYRR